MLQKKKANTYDSTDDRGSDSAEGEESVLTKIVCKLAMVEEGSISCR